MRTPLLTLTVGLLALTSLAACSGSTATSATTAAGATATTLSGGSTTLAATTLEQAATAFAQDSDLPIEQSTCIVNTVAGKLGTQPALDLFNRPGDLGTFPAAQQDSMVSAVQTCVPKPDFAKSLGSGLRNSMTGNTAGVVITDDQASCIGNEMIDKLGYKTLILGGSGTDGTATAQDQAAVVTAVTDCLPKDVLDKLQGTASSTDTTVGSTPAPTTKP